MKLASVILALVLPALTEGSDFWANRRVNCGVSLWSNWAPSPVGPQRRSRTIVREPRNGGTPCPSLTEVQGVRQGFRSRIQTVRGSQVLESVSGGDDALTILPRDLLIIIDASGGISRRNWTITKQKLADLIGHFCGSVGTGTQKNRIAVLTFSERVILNFNFTSHGSIDSARRAILNLPQSRRTTCTGDALVYAHRFMFDPETGIRPATKSVKEVLLLTDGQSNCGAEMAINIRRLQVKAFVFALGIGDYSIGRDEIKSMVSRPLADHIFSLANFFDFRQMVDIIRTYPAVCAPFELT